MPRTKEERQKIREEKKDSWIAVEEGDFIQGKILDVTEAWSDQRQNGSFYPLLTVGELANIPGYPPETYELKVHCFGAVLYNEVMKHQPEVGEKVIITYKGTGEAKPGSAKNPPELYSLRVEGRQDQAKRAYARIEGTQPQGPGTVAGRPVGATASSAPVEELPQLPADDDIPF